MLSNGALPLDLVASEIFLLFRSMHCGALLQTYRVFSCLSATFNNPKQIKYDAYNTQTCFECITHWYIFCIDIFQIPNANNWILNNENVILCDRSRQWVAMLFHLFAFVNRWTTLEHEMTILIPSRQQDVCRKLANKSVG